MADTLGDARPQGLSAGQRRVLTAGGFALGALFALLVATQSPPAGETEEPLLPLFRPAARVCISDANETYDGGGKLGFVFAAAGTYASANSYRCIAAIETLVRIGGWRGPTYLLTDGGEQCFDERLIRDAAGSQNVHVVHNAFERVAQLPHGLRVGAGSLHSRAKAFKGYMLDLIPDGPDVLVFHDCDKIFGQPGCVARMTQTPLRFDGGSAQVLLSAFRPPPGCRGYACADGIHAGALGVHRAFSAPLMRKWAELQLTRVDHLDRHTLWEVYNSSRTRAGRPLHPMGELPPPFQDHFWRPAPTGAAPFCVNHVSKGRCRAHGSNAANRFMRSLCLRSEFPARCPQKRLQKKALSWCVEGRFNPQNPKYVKPGGAAS